MLNDELRMSNKEPVTYSIVNKEPEISNQLHIAAYRSYSVALEVAGDRYRYSTQYTIAFLHSGLVVRTKSCLQDSIRPRQMLFTALLFEIRYSTIAIIIEVKFYVHRTFKLKWSMLSDTT